MKETIKELDVIINSDASGIQKGTAAAEKNINSLSRTAADLGKTLISAFAIGATVKAAITSVTDFQKAQQNVASLGVPMAGLEQGILALAGPLGSATELTQNLYNVISAGITEPVQALAMVEASAGFAKATLTEMGVAADAATTIFNVFGTDAGRISDILTRVVQAGKTTGQELASSFGPIASSAKAMGASFEDLAAATITLTTGGIKTSEAMTGLKAIFTNVATPTKDAAEVAERLGINFSIAGMQANGFAGFMQEVADKTKGNTSDLKALFGSMEAFGSAARLASQEGMASFVKAQGDIANSTGATKQAIEEQQKSFASAFDTIKNEVEAAVIQALLPALRDLAKWLTDHKDDIKAFFTGAIDVISRVVTMIGDMLPVLTVLGAAFATAFVASKMVAFSEAIGALVKNFALARSIGVDSVNAVGMSVEQTTGKLGALNKNITGVGDMFKTAHLQLMAFGVGFSIGNIIRELSDIDGWIQDFLGTFDTMEKKAVDLDAAFKQIDWGTKAAYESGQALEEMRKQSGLLGGSVKQLVKYFTQNKDAYEKLSKASRDIVKGGKDHVKADEDLIKAKATLIKKTEEEKKKTEESEKARDAAEKATKKYREEVEALAKSLGVVTKEGYGELIKKAGQLVSVFNGSKSQIEKSTELTDKFRESAKELADQFVLAGEQIPVALQNMLSSLVNIPEEISIDWSDFEELGGAMGIVEVNSKDLAKAIGLSTTAINDFSDTSTETLDYLASLDDFMSDAGSSVGELTDKKKVLTEEIERLKEQLRKAGDGFEALQIKMKLEAAETALAVVNKQLFNAEMGEMINFFGIASEAIVSFTSETKKSTGQWLQSIGQIVQQIPGWGQVIGTVLSIFGTLLDAFKTKKDYVEIAAKALQDYGGVATSTVEKLAALTKELNNSQMAFDQLLGEIISGAGKINAVQFTKYSEAVKNLAEKTLRVLVDNLRIVGENSKGVFTGMTEDVQASREQLTGMRGNIENLNSAFAAITERADEMGIHADQFILDTIRMAEEMAKNGVIIQSVFDYIDRKTLQAAGAFEKYMQSFKSVADIQKELAELEAGGGDQDAIAKKQQELIAAQGDIAKNWEFIQLATQNLFNTLREGGKSELEVIRTMQGSLQALADQARANGLSVSTDIQKMLDLSNFLNANQDLTSRIDALREMVTSLGDANRLSNEQFTTYANNAILQYNEIIARTGDASIATAAVGPILLDLEAYAKQYNFAIDDATQALIDQAKEAGVTAATTKTEAEKQTDSLNAVARILGLIAESFGVTLPDALREFGAEAQRQANTIRGDFSDLNREIERTGEGIDGLSDSIADMGGVEKDVMWTHSILPDMLQWQDEQKKINGLIKNGTTRALSAMGSSFNSAMAGSGFVMPAITPPSIPNAPSFSARVAPAMKSIQGISSSFPDNRTLNMNITTDGLENSYQFATKVRLAVESNTAGLMTAIARSI